MHVYSQTCFVFFMIAGRPDSRKRAGKGGTGFRGSGTASGNGCPEAQVAEKFRDQQLGAKEDGGHEAIEAWAHRGGLMTLMTFDVV